MAAGMLESVLRRDDRSPIVVAGAGPAGLAAAIHLAQHGYPVIVHEAKGEVGSRFGGDFQGLENWTTEDDVLEVMRAQGLTTDFEALPCRRGLAYDPRRQQYEIGSREPLFYMVERGPGPHTLDTALLRQAEALGVEIRFNSRLKHLSGEGILATGPKVADAIAVGYHFDTDMEDGFWVICDDNLAPKGYAYLLVMNGRGNVKTCMFEGFSREKDYVERTVETFTDLIGLDMKNPVDHGGSGNFRIPSMATSGKHPQIGEHAGFQDTLWGFGMRLAMTSGILAARSQMKGDSYERLWRQAMMSQMQASVVNRWLFSRLGNRGYGWFLARYSSSTDLRGALRSHYRMSFLKRMLSQLARFHYRSHRLDQGCHQSDCTCIYCRSRCQN